MNYKNKSEAYDNSESLSIWEGLHIIVSRWKLLLIITVIFCITGFIASLLTDKFHSYTAAYNIDTSDSTYYANNFITELTLGMDEFIGDADANKIIYDLSAKSDTKYTLTVECSKMDENEAREAITAVTEHYNNMLFAGINKKLTAQEDLVSAKSRSFEKANQELTEFSNGPEGYNMLELNLTATKENITFYTMQVHLYESLIYRVLNGIPLIASDIILQDNVEICLHEVNELLTNYYTEENLRQLLNYSNLQLEQNLITLAEIEDEYTEATTVFLDLKFKKEAAETNLNDAFTTFNSLNLAAENIESQYLASYILDENSLISRPMIIGIFLFIGLIAALLVVFSIDSYQNYVKNNRDS